MAEYLAKLPEGSLVLDLGSGTAGSFNTEESNHKIVRADLLMASASVGAPAANVSYVGCSAHQLPFADGVFQALVLNHSLEHFDQLDDCLAELGRIAAKDAVLFVAVPDASTICDRVYRWLGRGGGHVNPFRDSTELCRRLQKATSLQHAGTRLLYSSFSFLHEANTLGSRSRRMLLFFNGSEPLLRAATFIFRKMDRVLGTGLSLYGWAFYFGPVEVPSYPAVSNVCIRCGAGHPAAWLVQAGHVQTRLLFPDFYMCPNCGTRNYFTADRDSAVPESDHCATTRRSEPR